uniref:Transcription initiation factor IIB n=1 Tax=Fervidicoccus fontis TaxID=683846 RepID=A0A7J3ZKM3_9CREN
MSSTAIREQALCRDGQLIFDESRGEIICSSTGEVVSSIIDAGPEWREFSIEDRWLRSRNGGARTNLVHDQGLTTYISGRDVYRLDYSRRLAGLRLRRTQVKSRISSKRREIKALQILRREGEKLHLPKRTLETAAVLIRRVIGRKLGRGQMLNAYIASALFIACRITRVPRSFHEILSNLGVEIEKARYAYRKIVELEGGKIAARVYRPSDYIPKICTALKLSPATEKLMYRLSKAAEALGLTHGKSPLAIAAAAAYVASGVMGEKRDQKKIAESIGGFTDVAIRNRYRELIRELYIEVSL